MTLDKPTKAIVYLGLLFRIPVALSIIAVKLAWRGVSPTVQKVGSIGFLLCHPCMVIRNWKQPSVQG